MNTTFTNRMGNFEGSARLLRAMVEFAAKELNIAHLYFDLIIAIDEIIPSVICRPDGRYDILSQSAGVDPIMDGNTIYMKLGIAEMKDMLQSIAHEMVHVKQVVTKELIGKLEGLIYKGIMIPNNILNPILGDFDQYQNLPWEVEARHKADIIYNKFMEG